MWLAAYRRVDDASISRMSSLPRFFPSHSTLTRLPDASVTFGRQMMITIPSQRTSAWRMVFSLEVPKPTIAGRSPCKPWPWDELRAGNDERWPAATKDLPSSAYSSMAAAMGPRLFYPHVLIRYGGGGFGREV